MHYVHAVPLLKLKSQKELEVSLNRNRSTQGKKNPISSTSMSLEYPVAAAPTDTLLVGWRDVDQ